MIRLTEKYDNFKTQKMPSLNFIYHMNIVSDISIEWNIGQNERQDDVWMTISADSEEAGVGIELSMLIVSRSIIERSR